MFWRTVAFWIHGSWAVNAREPATVQPPWEQTSSPRRPASRLLLPLPTVPTTITSWPRGTRRLTFFSTATGAAPSAAPSAAPHAKSTFSRVMASPATAPEGAGGLGAASSASM